MGATFGFEAFSAFPFAFWEVVSFGNSLVKGINSGAPGRYFRSGTGTVNPYGEVSKRKSNYGIGGLPLQSGNSRANSKEFSQWHRVLNSAREHTSSGSQSAT
jgi:hypothetical protein